MKNIFNNNILELFWKLLPAQIFVSIANSLSNFVNGLIIGNFLDPEAMSALGLVMPMIAFIAACATIVSGGAGIVCGNYMGRGEVDKVDSVYSSSLYTLFVAGVVMTAACFSGAGLLAKLFNASVSAFEYTRLYIIGNSIGIIATLIIPCLMTFLQMCNKSGVSLLSTIVLAILNMLFNIVSIRVFNAGILGIGIATSLSKIVVMLLMFGYIALKKDLVNFKPKEFDMNIVKNIMILGSPASLAGILYSIRNVFINTYAGNVGGDLAVNSLAILGSFGGFLDAINIGLSSTFVMLASVFIGERDSKSLKDLIKISIVMGVLLAFGKLAVVYILNEKIPTLYGATGDLIKEAARLIQIYCWSAPPNMFTLVLIGTNQNLGRVKYCNALYVLNCIITPFVCCSVLSKVFGIDAIWWNYTIAELVTLSVMYVVSSIHNKGPVKNIDQMINLSKDFDVKNRYSISIDTIEEVVDIARKIESFCKEKHIDNRRAMLSGLCMEEMAGNVVEHGFVKDNKKNSIDILACIENDEVYLRLRDNCVPFDPKSKLAMHSGDDPIKNVGIKMVAKIAKQMNYQTTFGMNVLTIRL